MDGHIRNSAGGIMDIMTPEELLAKIATTAILTSKTRSTANLQQLLDTANRCDSEYIAQTAIYARTQAGMKDTPIVLLILLLVRKEPELFNETVPYILDNLGMIKKFVQLVRGGEIGIRSLGSAAKNYIKEFLVQTEPEVLFAQDYGTPTLKDLISLTHPNPPSTHVDYFSWLFKRTKEYPLFLNEYKMFLSGELTDRLPRYAPGILLLNHWNKMSDKQKDDLITRSTWTQIRKFYNQFSSHNKELTDSKLLDVDATTLRKDLESLVITWRNINYSPVFEQALNESIKYTPALSSDLNIQIFIDVSTSMYRHQYIDKALWLARYMATDKTTITTFNTEIEETITKEQLFSTSIRTLFSVGGSTRVTAALEAIQPETDLTIILSDNETWVENQTSTSVKEVYADLREQGKIKGKVVFWDLEFKPCVPVSDDNTLNMSGLNTQLINAVIRFASDSTSLVDTIKNIKIR